MSMENDKYICANRKCKHPHIHKDRPLVREKTRQGRKTLPIYRSQCPKCGSQTFYIDKPKTKGEPTF